MSVRHAHDLEDPGPREFFERLSRDALDQLSQDDEADVRINELLARWSGER
jgi:hypothetical protein